MLLTINSKLQKPLIANSDNLKFLISMDKLYVLQLTLLILKIKAEC